MVGTPDESPMGLGRLVAPQQEQGSGSWTSILQDPVARSAVLSFGLQAMTGGWGNGTQQLAAALGAGAQGAEGTANAIRAQEVNNRDFAAKQAEGAASRASHEKIASEGRVSREEIMRMKTTHDMELGREKIAGALDRATLRAAPKGDAEIRLYSDTYNKQLTKMKSEAGNPISPYYGMKHEALVQLADAEAKQTLENARNASGVRSQGQALPTGAPAAVPPTAGTGYRTDVTLDQIMSSPKSSPDAQQKMRTPEGRAALQKMFPHITPQQIDQYAKNHYLY